MAFSLSFFLFFSPTSAAGPDNAAWWQPGPVNAGGVMQKEEN